MGCAPSPAVKKHQPVIVTLLLIQEPAASREAVDSIAHIWEDVVDSVLESMLVYAAHKMPDPHIDLREEVILELAKLRTFLCERVVVDRMAGRTIKDIDPGTERDQCFDRAGKAKIAATARNCAEHVWLRVSRERWEPKTIAALKKEKTGKKERIVTPPQVTENHFIPKYLIKRYWTDGQSIYKCIKTPTGLKEKIRTPSGSWGFKQNLYSDKLEAYFGLLEGDAAKPIEMILNVEPLNRPQREALVGFIVIQRLRNPHFIQSLTSSLGATLGPEVKFEDKAYMRAVYETLYSQNDFYDKLARPILHSRWVIARSTSPDFVLPDVCNLFGEHAGKRFVLMPLTPRDCLIVLPIKLTQLRIVPHYILVSEAMSRDI